MAMRDIEPRGVLDRSAGASLFRHTLARIPSLFGRLMYLSSLRDPHTGAYRHYGLSTAFGREQTILALQSSHTRAFREWLRQPLHDKHADVVLYLESLDDPKGLVVKYWIESQGYAGCIPDSASKNDRTLFMEDLSQILNSLNHSSGGASKDPALSQRK